MCILAACGLTSRTLSCLVSLPNHLTHTAQVAGSEDTGVKITIPVMASSQIYPIAFPAKRAVALELLTVWT